MSALESNSVGGIPNTEADSSRGNESTPQQIHQEGAQYVREATQANQQSMSNAQSSGEGATGYSISTGPDYDDNSRSVPLESNRTSDNSTTTPLPSTLSNPAYSEADPAVTAGSHSTKTGADSSSSTANRMEDSEPRQQQSHEHHASNESGSGEHGHSEKSEEKKHGAKAENPDSIPTAGGEKLGEKHWGESQIVPELPPKRDSDAGQGVSSSAGQPNSEVADNTAANTGSATNPHADSSDAKKPGMMDKVKHTLHMDKK